MRLVLPVGLLAAALAAVVFLQLSRGGARSGFPAPDFFLAFFARLAIHHGCEARSSCASRLGAKCAMFFDI